jgi:hypothetical protein
MKSNVEGDSMKREQDSMKREQVGYSSCSGLDLPLPEKHLYPRTQVLQIGPYMPSAVKIENSADY